MSQQFAMRPGVRSFCARFGPILAILAACVSATDTTAEQAGQPQTMPATTHAATQPAATQSGTTQPVAISVTVDDLLSRIEAKHDSIRTLEAPLKYDRNQMVLNDKQRRFGKLIYVAGPPPKFAIHFNRVMVNKALSEQDRWYVFDGRYLVERLHDRKQFFRRELVPANKAGRKNPLAMGDSPLLIPLPLRKNDILKRYEISIIESRKTDPPRTVHMILKPRARQIRSDLHNIDLWIDAESLLPVKARTVDSSQYESVIRLDHEKAVINGPVNQKIIDTSLPTENGWQVEDVGLKSAVVTEERAPSRTKSE